MKQLFTGSSKKRTEVKREESMKHSTPMVRDYDMRSRYTEYKGNTKVRFVFLFFTDFYQLFIFIQYRL